MKNLKSFQENKIETSKIIGGLQETSRVRQYATGFASWEPSDTDFIITDDNDRVTDSWEEVCTAVAGGSL